MRRRLNGRWAPFAALAIAWLLTALRVMTPAAVRDPSLIYWGSWQDQTLYVRSASAFAHGDLAASAHWYPLLYPLLGVPFVTWWPSQPFFAANLACYLLAFAGFRRVAEAFGVGRWAAALVFAATTLLQFVFAKPWIEPWTTTASAALLWLAFGMATSLWIAQRPSRWQAAILGIAVALTPFARPGDTPVVVIAALLGMAALLRSFQSTTDRSPAKAGVQLRNASNKAQRSVTATSPTGPRPSPGNAILLWFIAAGAIAFMLAAIPYLLVYGPAPSPYMLFSAQYGFNFAWLGWKAYVLLVDPRGWFGCGSGLLERAPWLILGAAGLVQACLLRERRIPAIALTAAATLYTCLMLAYVDLLPSGLWRYNNVHYFKWLLPLFGLFAVRFVIVSVRRPTLAATLLPFLALLCIRIEPVPVGLDAPARMLFFTVPAGSEWADLYFATAWITDRSGEQRNSFDYHQLIDNDKVRAVALRRPFTGDERWIGNDHVRAQLEGRDASGFAPLYITGPWPRRPVQRYGARITIGLPDWRWGEDSAP